ncbi:hypothetical protein N9X52_02815 [Candidatus Poseidonia alphae]|nr:hypothetical protein [Candidatus Poseidonia alphae]
MQAPPKEKGSPWPMRLIAVGGAMILVGMVLLMSQSSHVSEAFDPRENHHGKYTGEGIFTTGAVEDTCYRFYQISGEESMTVELKRVAGAAPVGDTIKEANCNLDFQAMSGDNTDFVEVASWKLNATEKYMLEIQCEGDCSETDGWFVSIDSFQSEFFSSTWLIAGGAICCFGVLITPIALIVYLASKPGKGPRVMMINADGTMIPVTDFTPDRTVEFSQNTGSPSNIDESVAPPFADTTAKSPQSEDFVDGKPDVAAGNLLTTEQVFALMKGDVEAAQDHARTDRYQGEQPEQVEAEAANAAAIFSWDEGVEANEAVPERKKEKPATRPSTDTAVPAENDNGWKDWDEQ